MTTIHRLLAAVQDIWSQYNRHPFVLGIQDGSLEKEKFRFYILQDYLYLQDYAKTFAIGIAKAKSPETTSLFSSYVAHLTGSEMDIHRGYMGTFSVTQAEIDATPRALDNLSYTSYMLRVAYEEGEAEILTAILSCAYSYEIIAKAMLTANPAATDDPFYGPWVQGYASEAYAQENRILLDMLEKLTTEYTEAQRKHLEEIFATCSRYELAFWDMAWNQAF